MIMFHFFMTLLSVTADPIEIIGFAATRRPDDDR
jgi:hypothetical protein